MLPAYRDNINIGVGLRVLAHNMKRSQNRPSRLSQDYRLRWLLAPTSTQKKRVSKNLRHPLCIRNPDGEIFVKPILRAWADFLDHPLFNNQLLVRHSDSRIRNCLRQVANGFRLEKSLYCLGRCVVLVVQLYSDRISNGNLFGVFSYNCLLIALRSAEVGYMYFTQFRIPKKIAHLFFWQCQSL